MSHCQDCKYANYYVAYFWYPWLDPKCSIKKISIKPCDSCENFRGMGMKELVKFKQEYYNCILNGSKTQTMRIAAKRLDVNIDDLCIGVFPDGEELLLRITDKGYKAFRSIDDADAVREGFSSADDLKNTLLSIYEDYWLDEYSRVYYYRFECLGERGLLE